MWYVILLAYTAINYQHDSGAEVLPDECSVYEASPSSENGPERKSIDQSIQTVVFCLFNLENRMRNSVITQDKYLKGKRMHNFRRWKVLRSV